MTLKDKIINEISFLPRNAFKIRYYKQSPYQKRRYKAEYVEEECWLYLTGLGNCITASSWEDKDFREMIVSEAKTLQTA